MRRNSHTSVTAKAAKQGSKKDEGSSSGNKNNVSSKFFQTNYSSSFESNSDFER